MRVLMVLPQYPPPVLGGLERQAHELTVAVRERGVDAWVVSGRSEPDQPAEQEVDGVPVARLPFPRIKSLRFPVTGFALLRVMVARRADYDVVHAHNLSWFGGMAVIVAKLLGKPLLVKLPTAMRWAFRDGSLRLALFRSCDAIALLAPDDVADLLRLGYPASRIFKITNGVATQRFSPGPARADDGPLTAVYTGRLDPEKGLLDLLAVWPSVLARAGRPLRLVICGDGPLEGALRAEIAAHDLGGSVELRGRVADVPAILRDADVFVLPSFIEGNSNAVLEAMASGLPVVSTLAGGTPLLIGPEGHEWLFVPRDRPALEARLVKLFTDDAARRAAGAAMLRRARESLEIKTVAERYCCVYERLAKGRRDDVGACSSPIFP
jgi:glycosyltransferase involved in cell wall biosynthesis